MGRDLCGAARALRTQFAAATATDRATLFAAATEGAARLKPVCSFRAVADGPARRAVGFAAEFDFLKRPMSVAYVLVTVPFGDLKRSSGSQRSALSRKS